MIKMQKRKKKQNRLQHTTTIYLHPEVALFAKELTSKLPPGLDVAYFTNSGTEANDLAILLARAFTRNYDLLALRHAYHGGGGSPYGATAHSTWRHAVPAGFGVRHVACPDAYRGIFSENDGDGIKKDTEHVKETDAIGKKYARELQETIDTCTPGRVAGFLHESIQGVGGVRVRVRAGFLLGVKTKKKKKKTEEKAHFFSFSLSLSKLKLKQAVPLVEGFLKPAYESVRAAGGVCIADEVQTGFG